MSAEASMQCNAAYGERTDERTNARNGYRARPWDTRAGTIEDLAVPKLRRGVYSPEFLLQPRRRAEQALVAVICQAYVAGVSTRRVDDLVKALGIEGISKSEVSTMAAELDSAVGEFRERPLDNGPYRYLWIDALTQKVREGGRVVNVSAVIATDRERRGPARDRRLRHRDHRGHGCLDGVLTVRSLVARELSGVELVISDAHGGIKAAIQTVLSGSSWQRCRTHFMANFAGRVPKASWSMVATLLGDDVAQPLPHGIALWLFEDRAHHLAHREPPWVPWRLHTLEARMEQWEHRSSPRARLSAPLHAGREGTGGPPRPPACRSSTDIAWQTDRHLGSAL